MLLALCLALAQDTAPPALGPEDIRAGGAVIGLAFTDAEIELMLADVVLHLRSFERLRARPLANSIAPALAFDPLLPGIAAATWLPPQVELEPLEVERPADLEELAFADIATLGALLRARKVSCVELTQMYLERLRRIDATLFCVITYTEERALTQARARDRELDQGRWRGPLHGIPWGAKDLLAVRGYRTTWGAEPYAEQELARDAAVVQRLDEAGAVLIAKLSLGALAWGDVWFGGRTRNPWNPEEGSSGSSAGSASATAAGGVAFAIGSETCGSIVSPADRCGATGLRPTFGRVSRDGAMALAWSMDKLGPICRSVQDDALVFDAIHGSGGGDQSAVDLPYRVPGPVDVTGWRVGYLQATFEESPVHARVLVELEALGVELVPLVLPDYPIDDMLIVLSAEAAASFDELTRSDRDDELVRQSRQAWPNVLRAARLIPAVEYIQANRLRGELCRDLERALADVVAYVHPTFGGASLSMTNLTGHPALDAPCGFRGDGTPFGITFTGRLYDEARLLALAGAWQRSTEYHLKHPAL